MLTATSDAPWSRQLIAEVEAIARRDRIGRHATVREADDADIILFVDAHQHLSDWRMQAVRRHPYVENYPEKVFVYDERDRPRDSLPGLYVAMPVTRFSRARHRAVSYVSLPADTRGGRASEPDLLFSFQGRRLPGVRDAVLSLRHPRAVIEDTSRHDFFSPGGERLDGARSRYCETLARSKFVLCPRGAGASSFRLFETLACGRVPVILSDAWVPLAGVDWSTCAIRIMEEDVATVPTRLEAVEPDWERMRAAACAVYDELFAPEVWFDRAVEQCLELRNDGASGLRRQWLSRDYWEDAAHHLRPGWTRQRPR